MAVRHWVFQMSTISHVFGLQLWNLAALLISRDWVYFFGWWNSISMLISSRHICIGSMYMCYRNVSILIITKQFNLGNDCEYSDSNGNIFSSFIRNRHQSGFKNKCSSVKKGSLLYSHLVIINQSLFFCPKNSIFLQISSIVYFLWSRSSQQTLVVFTGRAPVTLFDVY